MNALSASDILTKEEVLMIMEYARKHRSRKNIRQNEIIFRLAVCCGLRVSEMRKLVIRDFMLDGPKPSIRIQKRNVKGKLRMRTVPLWWDDGNLSVMQQWIQHRKDHGAKPTDPVITTTKAGVPVRALARSETAARFKAMIRTLGPGRVRQISIHCGRHTFASHSISVGRSLVEVQQALGHSNIATTGIYLHLIERSNIPSLYA